MTSDHSSTARWNRLGFDFADGGKPAYPEKNPRSKVEIDWNSAHIRIHGIFYGLHKVHKLWVVLFARSYLRWTLITIKSCFISGTYTSAHFHKPRSKILLASLIGLLKINLVPRSCFFFCSASIQHQEHGLWPRPTREIRKSRTSGSSTHAQKFDPTFIVNGYKNRPSLRLLINWKSPESGFLEFESRWSPEIFRLLLYAIAKIAFITARIIASLDFISAVQYMINFIYHFTV